MTLLAVAVFAASAHFFLTSYSRFVLVQDRLETTRVRARMLKQEKADAERKNRILNRVKNFLDRAAVLGLEQSRWSRFDINIQEPATFAELERILQQCRNTDAYYFKPGSLHIKTVADSGSDPGKAASATSSADSPETKQGDVLLTLTGAFVIRNP